MSDFTAVLAVGQTLKALLVNAINQGAQTNSELPQVSCTLASPKEVRATTTTSTPASALSIWLYQVRRNPDLVNDPPHRGSPNQVVPQYLPVDLYYLLTPIYTSTEGEQALLGMVLQTLYDNSIMSGSLLAAPLDPVLDQIRVTLEALTLEELTRVWLALDEPYSVSVSYHVQLARISSARQPMAISPVLTRELDPLPIGTP